MDLFSKGFGKNHQHISVGSMDPNFPGDMDQLCLRGLRVAGGNWDPVASWETKGTLPPMPRFCPKKTNKAL